MRPDCTPPRRWILLSCDRAIMGRNVSTGNNGPEEDTATRRTKTTEARNRTFERDRDGSKRVCFMFRGFQCNNVYVLLDWEVNQFFFSVPVIDVQESGGDLLVSYIHRREPSPNVVTWEEISSDNWTTHPTCFPEHMTTNVYIRMVTEPVVLHS